MDKKEINREEIIAEYLTGNISYRALGKKYGIPSRSICDWVMRYQGAFAKLERKEETQERKSNWQERAEVIKRRKSSAKSFT